MYMKLNNTDYNDTFATKFRGIKGEFIDSISFIVFIMFNVYLDHCIICFGPVFNQLSGNALIARPIDSIDSFIPKCR